MGQAKLRGTLEQRQAEGIKRLTEEAKQRTLKRAEQEAARTPEEREQSKRINLMLASMIGIVSGATHLT